MDSGESLTEALRREVAEETQTHVVTACGNAPTVGDYIKGGHHLGTKLGTVWRVRGGATARSRRRSQCHGRCRPSCRNASPRPGSS
ncbi:hypothetical protein [Streptomyces sp. ISL-11]|uniref:hypothetical protein n=1 Tax=Streptomyces sp. ISL-11 TaxID=2819174 RepID=UPI0035B068D3